MTRIHHFTIVELMVVIGIIFILAGMMLPALSSAKRKAREINCVNSQKQIGILLIEYEGDYNGLPYSVSNAQWGSAPDIWIRSAQYMDPKQQRWSSVYYDIFLLGSGYTDQKELFLCPLYGSK